MSLILDVQFVIGAGGRHMALVLDAKPCGYFVKDRDGVVLFRPGTVPPYLSAMKARRFVSFEEAREAVLLAARAQPNQMVIAL